MAYGEFVSSALKDYYRAEQLLREAVSLSFSHTVWPCIALAHFLHYTRGQHAKSSRLLKWVLRKRRKLSKQEINELDQRLLGVDEDGVGLGEEEEMYEDEIVDINPTFDYEVAAVMVSLAYFYFDIDDYNTARTYATSAVKLDPTLTSAHRMLGLIAWQNSASRNDAVKSFTTSLKHANGNPYTLRTCSVILALEGNYREAYHLMSRYPYLLTHSLTYSLT